MKDSDRQIIDSLEWLVCHQKPYDKTGEMVAVSKQALDDVIAEMRVLRSGRTVSCICGGKGTEEYMALQSRLNDVIAQRNESEAKWHAHQKNVPCSGCAGGHDTFWKTVIESPQWKAWEVEADRWDTAECAACGHISDKHFQAFVGFLRRQAFEEAASMPVQFSITEEHDEDAIAHGIMAYRQVLRDKSRQEGKP